MIKKEIQIVAFNNPYPPNFGGAIDMFYKIKALSELGVLIHLHVFYNKREDISGLNSLCKTIHMYKSNKSLIKHLSLLPYCVNTRLSKELINNLNKNKSPIIFESIRTTGGLIKNKFEQKTAIRCHNIEHDYSWGLFKSERNWFKKVAFLIEGYKLKYYEYILNKTDFLLTLSYFEYSYYSKSFESKSFFLPVFHGNENVKGYDGFGKYALYHGDLAISDNVKSAFFIISIFKDLKEELIIASSTKNTKLINEISKYENINFELIVNENQLKDLIKNAHINVLYSFQKSGTKLKVFNALYIGRHCILNENIIDDSDILDICEVATTKKEYQKAVNKMFKINFEVSQKRLDALKKYGSKLNAEKLIEIIF